MAVSFGMKLLGVDKVKAELRELKKLAGKPALRAAARAGAAVIRDEARRRLHTKGRTGKLAKAIVVEEKRSTSPEEAIAIVAPLKQAFFLRFVESGTKPHEISIYKTRGRGTKVTYRTKRALAFQWFGHYTFFRTRVKHPGARARPFLVPAYEAKRGEAVQAMANVYNERLRKLKHGTP